MKSLLKFIVAVCSILIAVQFLFIPSENWIKHRGVELSSEDGSCSGQQVRAPSGKDYILTAAHCAGLADENGMVAVKDEEGNIFSLKILQEDPKSDLLLVEGIPNLRGLTIADSWYRNEEIRTFTHGKHLDLYKTEGVLIQETTISLISEAVTSPEIEQKCKSMPKKANIIQDIFGRKACLFSVEETLSTAKIIPGSSGGMVVDPDGKLVGVVSVSSDEFSGLVRLSDIKDFMSKF